MGKRPVPKFQFWSQFLLKNIWLLPKWVKAASFKLSSNLTESPQIGVFFKTAPLWNLSGYWSGHVLVTITWINQKIQSAKPVGLTSLWSSVSIILFSWDEILFSKQIYVSNTHQTEKGKVTFRDLQSIERCVFHLGVGWCLALGPWRVFE